ncbi:Ketoreductase azaE [Colletotrichum gloeosporioides]|uniref:Ketoreductase azaE n=1 Tax=Colletotrichum gloeosporioides TaxID=474922 RepID=A0A8H4FNP6_COLGL|nr:Ketoreductase azaE [Colletotrichum gloeosporioides]KAF3808968.1 Ketoreductase azaE [Colletotrichum gloeosporioides]
MEGLRHRLSCLIPTFLKCINYTQPAKPSRDALREAILSRGREAGVYVNSDDGSRMRFEAGLAVAAEMYPLHPFDIQVHIGLFTWLGFIIDDLNAELGPNLANFQSRFSRGDLQPCSVLECFADVLRSTTDYYDPVVANLIVLSALAFVNSNAIEIRRDYQAIIPSMEAPSWPYYFRDKEGLPEVYTYFCFYRDMCPDISRFMPAAPEMGKFINLTNDILSFYKEEKAGELALVDREHEQALSILQLVVQSIKSFTATKMTRVLLTGGSGFIATHILRLLLERGHSVVTTVRNQAKADAIRASNPGFGPEKLHFAIVPDVVQPDAFNEAVKSDAPFEAVIHTASPFTFNVTDIQADLLDPAINGTTASKTFAEKAAWSFVENESPGFTLSTINPPLVFGPAVQELASLDALNTSNQFIRSFILGAAKKEIAPTTNPIFADVRDVAFAHVMAMEKEQAANQRFFITGGCCSNRQIIDIIRKNFPEYKSALPSKCTKGGELPDKVYQVNNQKSINVLGLKYRSFEECVVDTVRSFGSVEK